ncbi:hypothetical protein ACYTU4_27065 (plasmid) [Escherichia coli]
MMSTRNIHVNTTSYSESGDQPEDAIAKHRGRVQNVLEFSSPALRAEKISQKPLGKDAPSAQ